MAEDTGNAVAEAPEGTEEGAEGSRIESGPELTMTQEDVDRVVESRLARERRKFADYDELQEKASAYDELAEASKSEAERIQEENSQLRELVEELTDANSYVAARSIMLQEVAKPENNIVDPEGAIEFLMGADQDLVEVDEEDGLPTNIEDAVKQLTERRSYLVKTAEIVPRSDADQGARGGNQIDQLSESDLQRMTPQQIVQARGEGRLDNILQGGE